MKAKTNSLSFVIPKHLRFAIVYGFSKGTEGWGAANKRLNNEIPMQLKSSCHLEKERGKKKARKKGKKVDSFSKYVIGKMKADIDRISA
jgi:uncharacterized protein YdaU (DUF1376 family)